MSAGVAALVLIVLLVIAFKLAGRPNGVDASLAWSGEVKQGEFVHEVTAAGSLIAPEIRTVTNRSDGVVERVSVLPGQGVRSDSILVELSNPILGEELLKARSALKAALADDLVQRDKAENDYINQQVVLAGIESDYSVAQFEAEAKRKLRSSGAVSESDIRSSELRAEHQRRRLAAARAQFERQPQARAALEASGAAKLEQLRHDLSRLERQISDLEVRAGFAGVVQTVDVEAGERVGVGTQIARVVNSDNLIARVKVSERDASLVQLGQGSRLEMGRQTLTGTVTRIEPVVHDRLVTVDIAFESDNRSNLRPDLSVTARIEIMRIADTLVIDRPVALREDQSHARLFRLDSGSKSATRVDVEIGRMSARQVEIVRGLDPGDKVILADMTEWADEPRIRIR